MHCWWRKAINTTHLAGLWASGMHNKTSLPTILWGNTRMIKHTDSTSITQLMCSINSSFCYTDTKQASCLYREVNTRERNMKLHRTLILCHAKSPEWTSYRNYGFWTCKQEFPRRSWSYECHSHKLTHIILLHKEPNVLYKIDEQP